MNLMVAFFAGAGAGVWIYSEVMRSTGGNTQNAVIVSGFAGVAAFVVMLMVMNALPQF